MKRTLLICYAFPPVAGMSPLRVVHLARMLHERGHGVTVLTADAPPGYALDPDGARLIPPDVRVLRLPAGGIARLLRPAGAEQGSSSLNSKAVGGGSLFLRLGAGLYRRILRPVVRPDAVFEWRWAARRRLDRMVGEEQFDVIYSLAYPFSCHYLGCWSADAFAATWIMDYGDPWSINPNWTVPTWRKRWDRAKENVFLARSDFQAFTTEATRQAYLAAFPRLDPARAIVSTCGHDEDLYASTAAAPGDASRFRLVYSGLYGMANRSTEGLLEALGSLSCRDWELILIGRNHEGDDIDLVEYCEQRGIRKQVHFLGHLSHREVVAWQKSADLLVMWGWPGGLQIPAKVFEYFAARRPILVIQGDRNDPAGQLVGSRRRGFTVQSAPQAIAPAIGKALEDWRQDRWPGIFDLAASDEFSWRVQSGHLADLWEQRS